MIALDRTIRDRAKGIDDGSEYAGFGLVSGGLAVLYGTGLSTDDEQMRHMALTGIESAGVSGGCRPHEGCLRAGATGRE